MIRLAADQGYPEAQFYLGFAYTEGRGVPRDDAEAARWVRLAADQGHPYAQGHLGRLYAEGRGVEQDLVAAHTWLSLAALQVPGGEGAAILQARAAVEAGMTVEQIARARADLEALTARGPGGP